MSSRVVALLLAVAAAVAPAGPAGASCAALPPLPVALARADVVFVGEVTATTAGGRAATVRVTEVWKGRNVPPTVEVVGGETSPNVVSSVDRSYVEGTTYLFVPYDASAPYRDNVCTATRRYSERVERLRPAGVAPPGAADAPGDGATDRRDDDGSSWSAEPLVGAALLIALAWTVLRTRLVKLPPRT
ncbi:MAG TPA: hypothetical protein VHJ34_04775 [Actinomycetota bacterium]|nr:hypothetical protein [Actinomycetota bacterium]